MRATSVAPVREGGPAADGPPRKRPLGSSAKLPAPLAVGGRAIAPKEGLNTSKISCFPRALNSCRSASTARSMTVSAVGGQRPRQENGPQRQAPRTSLPLRWYRWMRAGSRLPFPPPNGARHYKVVCAGPPGARPKAPAFGPHGFKVIALEEPRRIPWTISFAS